MNSLDELKATKRELQRKMDEIASLIDQNLNEFNQQQKNSSNQDIPQMVTIQEASKLTGISMHHIRKLCIQKEIVFIRAGNKYLINFGKFIEYLNEGQDNA